MTDIEKAEAEVFRLRARFESYGGGDRPMSPPAALMSELFEAEERLRALRAEKKAAHSPLDVGMRVWARHNPKHDHEFNSVNRGARMQHNQHDGWIVQLSDPHGSCFRVQFPLGDAWYHPDELSPIPAGFQPSAEEIAVCPVLAEVRGMPEREAVLCLAKRLADTRKERDLSLGVLELGDKIAAKASRPRVGPWVAMAVGEYQYRFDGHGQVAGSIAPVGPRRPDGLHYSYSWNARRAFAEGAGGETTTLEEARVEADAVLATWAELSYEDAPMRVDVAAPLQSSVRLWTEEQVREAWYRAQETGRPQWQQPRSPDDLANSWSHVRGALTGEKV